MLLDEHNMLAQESILNVYNVHKCDIIDTLELAIHRQKNYYHPIRHDNAMAVMFLECQRVNKDKNHIPSDVLWPHRPLYQVEYYHFYRTRITNSNILIVNHTRCVSKARQCCYCLGSSRRRNRKVKFRLFFPQDMFGFHSCLRAFCVDDFKTDIDFVQRKITQSTNFHEKL